MLTVIVAFDGSRNSSTCSPLSSRYSAMPSTVVTWVTAVGQARLERWRWRRREQGERETAEAREPRAAVS